MHGMPFSEGSELRALSGKDNWAGLAYCSSNLEQKTHKRLESLTKYRLKGYVP